MGTRSTIIITGKNAIAGRATTRLYKHNDGYPTANLTLICMAIKQVHTLLADEDDKHALNVSTMTGLLIGAATHVYGMGAVIDTDGDGKPAVYNEALKDEHLGYQDDLEWVYVVDLEAKEVRILGGGFGRFELTDLGDPYAYAAQHTPPRDEVEKHETTFLIAAIETWGFSVVYNTGNKPANTNKPTKKTKRPPKKKAR